jgi:hypothetical protein
MSRTITVAAVTAVLALAAVGTASAAPSVPEDSVGPALTFNLKMEHKKPTKPTSRRFRITNVRANANGLGASMMWRL